MSHPDPEELAGLALDPAGVEPGLGEHVESCRDCRALLDALTEVRGLAGDGPELLPAPPGVRDRVLAATTDEPSAGAETSNVVPLAPADRRRGVPGWLALVAAAVTLVAGVGLGRLTAGADGQPDDTASVVAAADLTSLEGSDPRGLARVVDTGGSTTLRVRARDLGDEDGFHEVWLINVDGTRMVALGVLPEGDVGEFEVPQGLLDEGYRIVDISVEPDDGDPTHSGVSLARGELA
jgi:hypothetical protein